MEDLKDKVGSVDLGEECVRSGVKPDGEDSDDSFHSLDSEDEDGLQDTQSSFTESSEHHLTPDKSKPNVKADTKDFDTDDDDDEWLPANQHTQDTTHKKRRRRNRLDVEEARNKDDESSGKDEDDDSCGREEEKGARENKDNQAKEKKEDESSDKDEDDDSYGREEEKGARENKDNQAKEKKEDEEEEDEEDFIDEEHLKDLELSMTDEDRNNKRGESLQHKESGNSNFKCGNFVEAVFDYTSGLRVCPLSFPRDRAVLYGNRAAAKARLERRKAAIKDCSRAVELDGDYVKVVLRRATLEEEEGLLDEALKDYQRVLELDPSCQEANIAVRKLPDMITEKNEKLKEEMMGKLKDLGNMFLRPFGLSTSNFEMKQDPKSGGYNISFNQNQNS